MKNADQAALRPARPILIVDDKKMNLVIIDAILDKAGWNHTITCQESAAVMATVRDRHVAVVLLDLKMPGIRGEDLLVQLNAAYPELPIIVVTGTTNVQKAVWCMQKGAFDYVAHPVDEGLLTTAVNRALTFDALRRENLQLKRKIRGDTLDHPEAFAGIITQNSKMLSLFRYVEAVAHTSQIVLITGETGVGKEMIPGIIHRLSGLAGPMLTVNVAGLDDTLFSDTLFGHVKGAFTGAQGERRGLVEEAAGGTLFLDEIGNLSPSSQLKLLRLLQEGEYHPLGQDRVKHADVRIIAATNEDLWQLENRAKFRKDLIYRLRTHHLHLPPLRERREDIPLLVDFFLAEAARDLGKPKPTPPKELNDLLGTYPFPGNIRELKALVFDAVSRHTRRVLSLDVFREYISSGGNEHRQPAHASLSGEDGIRFPASLPTIEKATRLLIAEAMQRANNNQRIASNLLGISQPALSKRLKKYKEME